MRHRPPAALLLTLAALALWTAPDAEARGGRFALPPGARVPAQPLAPPGGGPGVPTGGGNSGPFLKPGDEHSGRIPMLPPPARVLPAPAFGGGPGVRRPGGADGAGLGSVPPGGPNAAEALGHGNCGGGGAPVAAGGANESGVPSVALGGRKRPVARLRRAGLDDWTYWYDANREEFEDLRAGAYVTEGNPLFALGGSVGARAGEVERRLAPKQVAALKTAVRDVLAIRQDAHWMYTQGAAYVALGKIASGDAEVEILTRALLDHDRYTQFVRESAALGLGQLRRSEARRQLPGTTLDRVRAVLQRVLEDDGFAARTRAFAALSLGLLADQPAAGAHGGRHTARRLLDDWLRLELPDETQVGLLMGLGLVGRGHVGSLERLALRACAVRSLRKGRRCSSLVRAQAVLALGRLGGSADVPALLALLQDREPGGPALRQAALIAAGTLGRHVPAARVALAEAVLQAGAAAREPAARRLALMSVARLLAWQASAPGPGSTRGLKLGAALRHAAAKGAAGDRAFAALALAVAVRAVDESVDDEAWQRLRSAGLDVLREGLADPSLDGHARAAYATALGIAGDRSSTAHLLSVLGDADADPDLRAYAALGLGLLREARQDVLVAVRAALGDARSDRLRMNAVTAIGLLGGGGARERERTLQILLAQLERTANQNVRGQVAITLARIGDARAVAPLIGVLEGEGETHLTRSMACAALGLLGDEERTPVLSAARRDSHYTSGSSVVFEVLDVL